MGKCCIDYLRSCLLLGAPRVCNFRVLCNLRAERHPVGFSCSCLLHIASRCPKVGIQAHNLWTPIKNSLILIDLPSIAYRFWRRVWSRIQYCKRGFNWFNHATSLSNTILLIIQLSAAAMNDVEDIWKQFHSVKYLSTGAWVICVCVYAYIYMYM